MRLGECLVAVLRQEERLCVVTDKDLTKRNRVSCRDASRRGLC